MLTRSWCLWEILCTVEARGGNEDAPPGELHIQMSPKEVERYEEALLTDMDAVINSLQAIP